MEHELIFESDAPVTLWYLSFADASLPAGQQWLGGCFVEHRGALIGAVSAAHAHGCNPGGGVYGGGLADDVASLVPAEYRSRLLTRDDLRALDVLMGNDGALVNLDGEEV